MTGLLEAIPFLRGAVGRTGTLSTYTFSGGVIHARSPAIFASYPVPHILGDVAIAAEEIESAISRMKNEPEVGAGDGTIILRSGRIKATLDLQPYVPPNDIIAEDMEWRPLPTGLVEAIRTARSFISSEGNWQRSVYLNDGKVVAVNGRSAIEIDVPELDISGFVLPDECVSYLLDVSDPPIAWAAGTQSAVFSWENGGYAKLQALALAWPSPYNSPAFIDQFAASAKGVEGVAVTDDYRSAFADVAVVANLSDGTVTVTPTAIVGKSSHATQEVEFATSAKGTTRWSIKTLTPVLAVAEEWFPDSDGPAFFRASGVRGIVMSQRTR